MMGFFGLATCPLALFAQVDFASSNLPIVIIDTNHGQEIPDDPKIEAWMSIIWNGDGASNRLDDAPNNYQGKIGIELRGSSSQSFPKKQYGIELQDENGEGISASILGLPEEEDWILFAPYNDKSLMRDMLAYQLGRTLGGYAPRTKYCEVVLNGNYQGVYLLIEKIKRDKNRLDINKLDPDEISGDDLTGGYIIKIDKWTGSGGDGWQSSHAPLHRWGGQNIFFQYEYPKQEDIVSAQRNYIRTYFRDFENALIGPKFDNAHNGYLQFIDRGSFIDFFIMNELTKNVDGYRISTFMHKKRDSDGGKLHMGPIWDFNLGFGNADYCAGGYTSGWAIDFNQICGDDGLLVPFWWERLMQDEAYQQHLATRWAEVRQTSLSESFINAKIDSVYNLLNAGAQQRNFQQWPVLGEYVWPNFYVGQSFPEEVNWLKSWISSRLAWMDAHMPEIKDDVLGNSILSDEQVSVYPNPFQRQIQIKLSQNLLGSPVIIEIFDSIGKMVLREEINLSGDHHEHLILSFDQADLSPKGAYHYRISNKQGFVKSGKLVRE